MATKQQAGGTPPARRKTKTDQVIERMEPELLTNQVAELLEDSKAADVLVSRERARRRSFLEGRQRGVGTSELHSILTGGALTSYLSKTRPVTDDDVVAGEDVIDLMRGVLLEPLAISMYWKVTGRTGKRERGQMFHPEYPGAMCSPDVTIFEDQSRPAELRDTGTGEVKAPRSWVYGELATHGTRESILFQIQGAIAVRRKSWGSLGYFNLEHNEGPLIPVDIPAQPDIGVFLLEMMAKFWTEHVVPRVPPKNEEWAKLIEKAPRLKPIKRDEVLRVIGDRDEDKPAVAWFRSHVQAKSAIKESEAIIEEVKGALDKWLVETFGPSVCKFEIPTVGKITRVRAKGQKYLDKGALHAHKPIDRDAFVRWYQKLAKGIADGRVATDPKNADAIADALSLDLDAFKRDGDPYEYLLLTPAK